MNMKNMETNPFKQSNPETSSEDNEDTSDRTSSKKKKKNRRLSFLRSEHEATQEKKNGQSEKAETINDADTLWRKLINQSTETTTEKTDEKTRKGQESAKESREAEAVRRDGQGEATVEAVDESDVPLESLSKQEQAAVAAEYIAARRAEVMAEQSPGEADETLAAEQAADLALLDAMQHLLERNAGQPASEGQAPMADSLQEAYAATMQRLTELEPAIATAVEPTETSASETLAHSGEPEPQDFPLHEAALAAEQYDDTDAPTTAAGTPMPIPVWQRNNPTAGSGSHGSGGSGGPTGPGRLQYAGGTGTPNGNIVFTRPNVAPTPAAPTIEVIDNSRNRTGSALLLGAVVGYLIGRRRGRIKTEKRLQSVEKKLTRDVEAARQQVAEKESQIRRLAREKYQQSRQRLSYEPPVASRNRAAEYAAVPLAREMAEAAAPAALGTQQERSTRDQETAASPSSRAAQPERFSSPVTRSERLGLGLVTLRAAEAAPTAQQRNEAAARVSTLERDAGSSSHKQANEQMHGSPREALKTSSSMNREELLKTGGEISVGATNLRRVYETQLISEQGLRRLVAVHERGGDVREVLEQELIEKETSYERDPRLRNRSRSMMGMVASAAVVRAEIDQASTSKAAGDSQSDETNPENSSKNPVSQPTQRATITAGIAMAVILAVLLYLLFTGRSL
jgi:hypothetical protein